MDEISQYYVPLSKSGILIVVLLFLRFILKRTIHNYAIKIERIEHRTGLIIKYVDFAFTFLMILGLISIWGVDFRNLGLVMSSVFAVIGIAFFAQWSILSNVTSGIIMFFTFPYKIGDYIKIHDKEFPSEGFIEDIKSFHVILHTINNEQITYPNSLMLQKGVTIVKPDKIPELEKEIDKNTEELPHD